MRTTIAASLSFAAASSACGSRCDDQGEDPAGLTFPQEAETAEVWTGAGAEEAVALKTDDGLRVFVSEALSAEERKQVAAEVGLEQ